jgi:hypothetical protein
VDAELTRYGRDEAFNGYDWLTSNGAARVRQRHCGDTVNMRMIQNDL